MNQITKLFSYNGNEVTFRNSKGVAFVNATQMAKSFGKQPVHWLNQSGTNDFINELSKLRNRSLTELVIVSKGGSNPGTWMHEDVALEFSRWLSPAFSIWCNDRIKELLSVGFTTTKSIEDLVENPDLIIEMAGKLKELRSSNERMQEEILLANQTITKQAPKVKYVDEVLATENLISATTIAKELGMSAMTMNKKLQDIKVQFRHNGHYVLYSNYQGKGYTKTKTHTYLDSNGNQQISIQTYWTQLGRAFLHKKLNPNLN